MVNGARWIRSEKLREHKYMEEYARYLQIKREGWDEERNVGAGKMGNN